VLLLVCSSTSLTVGLLLLEGFVACGSNGSGRGLEAGRTASELLLLVKRTLLLASLALELEILRMLTLGGREQGLTLLGSHGHDLHLLGKPLTYTAETAAARARTFLVGGGRAGGIAGVAGIGVGALATSETPAAGRAGTWLRLLRRLS
jgi:hypothetical protein